MTHKLSSIVEQLCGEPDGDATIVNRTPGHLPSVPRLMDILRLIREVMFPDFFDERTPSSEVLRHLTAVRIARICTELAAQIRRACRLTGADPSMSDSATSKFVETLPSIRQLLLTDVSAMFANDPAATDRAEVIFCYPAFTGMFHYRIAHALLVAGVPLLPRIITEIAHSQTGIDIHPGAVIGHHFSIDHGTGVVIGETCVIGKHVTLYQGVTLGAKNFSLDSNGRPVNIPRHPIIEDNVTIYSNATVLGRITIGRGSIVGGNIWLTYSVPPGSRILQRKAVATSFTDGLGI